MRWRTRSAGPVCTTGATSAIAQCSASRSGSRAQVVQFDHPAAHVVELAVRPEDIDAYEHVNNAVYLTWLDRAAWSHSTALGVPLGQCVALRRGMAAPRIDYVCINLDTGRAVRMPESFARAYVVTPRA